MLKLSLRFINHEQTFNYRIALEIGLIISLIICCSGIITGLTAQFAYLTNADSTGIDYLISEGDVPLTQSSMPVAVFNSINSKYLNYKLPFLVEPATINGNIPSNIYYTQLNTLEHSKNDFNLIQGALPTQSGEFLVGKGLMDQYNLSFTFPQVLLIKDNNINANITVTGLFWDSGPWFFSFLSNLDQNFNNNNYITFIKIQLKNKVNLPEFTKELDDIYAKFHVNYQYQITELKQRDIVSKSFFSEISQLFNVLIFFLFVLMTLKFFHSSYIVLNRLKNEYLISKILGMTNFRIQGVFLTNLVITGNIGVLLGIFIGLVLPQLLMVLINPFFSSSKLFLIPSYNYIFLSIVISNCIFFISSWAVYLLKLENFQG